MPSPLLRDLRILMTTDAVGGVWTYALDLARGLAHGGATVTLAVLGPAPDAGQVAEAQGIPDVRLIATGLRLDWTAAGPDELFVAARRVADLARKEAAHLVHLNSPALAAARAFQVPVIGSCHSCTATWWAAVRGGPLPPDFVWRKQVLAQGYAACDALIAPSSAFADATAEAYGCRPLTVHNGRAVLGETRGGRPPASPPFVFTAGRLWDEGKNIAALDAAAGQIDVPVLAAGPLTGPNGAAVALQHVQSLGKLSPNAVGAYLAEKPIFCSPASYEPFGLSVLEAAQAGCALVLSDIPTFRELWGGAAVFVEAGAADALARAIARLVSDPEERHRLSSAAAERARRYTLSSMLAGTLEVYEGVLRKGRRPGAGLLPNPAQPMSAEGCLAS